MGVLIGIDPGQEKSAAVWLRDGQVVQHILASNQAVREHLLRELPAKFFDNSTLPMLVIEWVKHYGSGMPAGATTFETVRWIGRYQELWEGRGGVVHLLPRGAVKLHLCGSARAKDANVRQALIDRFGGSKEKAIGSKKSPGPLYGIGSHLWAALSVAVTFDETGGVSA